MAAEIASRSASHAENSSVSRQRSRSSESSPFTRWRPAAAEAARPLIESAFPRQLPANGFRKTLRSLPGYCSRNNRCCGNELAPIGSFQVAITFSERECSLQEIQRVICVSTSPAAQSEASSLPNAVTSQAAILREHTRIRGSTESRDKGGNFVTWIVT